MTEGRQPITQPADAPHDTDIPSEAVQHAPLEEGTDPLGDDRTLYRRKGQLIISALLGALFTVLAVIDVSSGHAGRGLLAAVVALLNIYIAAKEQRKPMRPQR